MWAAILSNLLYIGARDQIQRESEAAAKVEYLYRDPNISDAEREAASAKVADEYKVSTERVMRQAGSQAQNPQSYGYSPGQADAYDVVEVSEGVDRYGQPAGDSFVASPSELGVRRQAALVSYGDKVYPTTAVIGEVGVNQFTPTEHTRDVQQAELARQQQTLSKPQPSLVQNEFTAGSSSGSDGLSLFSMAYGQDLPVARQESPSFLQKVRGRFDARSETLQQDFLWAGEHLRQKRKRGEPDRIAQLGVGVGYLGFRFLKGAASPIVHPVQTAKSIVTFPFRLVSSPKKTVKEVVQPFIEEPVGATAELFGSASTFKGLGKLAKPIINKPVVAITKKVNPKYVKTTGVKIVEDVSIPTKLSKLRSFEGKTVPTVHTTLASELKAGSIIKPAELKYMKGWRKEIGQRSFYTSSPVEAPIQKLTAAGWVDVPFSQTPLSTKYQPVAYGGYIGIGKGRSASQVKFSLLPEKPKALIFRDTKISKTPNKITGMGVKDVVKFQSEKTGTYVAAENIKGLSTEGQFTTSPGTDSVPLVQVVKKPGPLQGKFTYHDIKKEIPKIMGGEKAPKPIKTAWDFLTSDSKKIRFEEVGFKELKKQVGPNPVKRSKPVDMIKYSKSYGKTKYVSSVDVIKKSPSLLRLTPSPARSVSSKPRSSPKVSSVGLSMSSPKSSGSKMKSVFSGSSSPRRTSSSIKKSSSKSVGSKSRQSSSKGSSFSSMFSGFSSLSSFVSGTSSGASSSGGSSFGSGTTTTPFVGGPSISPEFPKQRKPKVSKRPTFGPSYKPSVLGIDIFKQTGMILKSKPGRVSGLGVRLPTAKMVGKKPKSPAKKRKAKSKSKKKRGKK